MSMNPFARRNRPLILVLLLCGLALQALPAAAALSPILQGYWYKPSLESGNGNKIAVGRFNHLHAVFEHEDTSTLTSDIVYTDMGYDTTNPTDPYLWNYQQLSSDGVSSQPAVAVDGSGLAAVVWVSRPSSSNPLGAIWYMRQTAVNCQGGCWSQPRQVVYQGSEPSIAAMNGVVHLAWTSGDRVQYTSFPIASPPALPLWLGEVVDSTNCPGTRFHQPSIALAFPPCGALSVRIASLLTSNEQATAGACHLAATQSGPRVYERNVNTQTWSTVFQELTSNPASNQPDPVAVSISMNANRITGDFYLAWSDEQNSAGRTRVGHGKAVTWDVSQQVSPLSHDVHVAAKSGGAAGHFRLALGGPGWSTSAYTQTGRWNGGLTWTGPAITIPASPLTLAGHPEALYWSRCASSQLREIKTYTQASTINTNWFTEVAIDPSLNSPVNCFQIAVGNAVQLPNCYQTHLLMAQMLAPGGGDAVLVDFGDTFAAAKLTETGAELTTLAGATIQVTWAPGEVLYSWANGFAVATSRESVRFSSKDTRFDVEDLGWLDQPGGK
ncbi:MAG: hypothetical protein ABIS20_21475 [Thermoanaerobaculia bacterium]